MDTEKSLTKEELNALLLSKGYTVNTYGDRFVNLRTGLFVTTYEQFNQAYLYLYYESHGRTRFGRTRYILRYALATPENVAKAFPVPSIVKNIKKFPYCEYGQFTKEEMEDEFGIICKAAPTHKFTFKYGKKSFFVCPEHLELIKTLCGV